MYDPALMQKTQMLPVVSESSSSDALITMVLLMLQKTMDIANAAMSPGKTTFGTLKIPVIKTLLQKRGTKVMNAMNSEDGKILSFDGIELFYYYWEPQNNEFDKILLVLHGIGFHSKPYQIVAHYLNPEGIGVYALDTRGHGHSSGKRGVLDSPHALVEDVKQMINFLHESHPEKKIFILGESMGGSIALAYTANYQDTIAGLILVAPGLQLQVKHFLGFETFKVLFGLMFNRDAKVVSLTDDKLESSSRKQEFIQFKRNDPLSLDRVSVSYLLTLNALNSNWKSRYAEKIMIPTLILHGGKDSIINPNGSQKLYAALATSDKKIVLLPDAYHTLFWDTDTPKVFDEIIDWLRVH
jgi:alpha-beta hydrolase superfamily lysophospholipase